MNCPRCGHATPDGSLFCDDCGAKLELICAACGAINQPGARFCKKCGARVATESAPTPPSRPHAGTPTASPVRIAPEQSAVDVSDGERKTVTALFADIKGSMELMEDLDPEEARAIVDPALKVMIDSVHHYDGYVAQSTGDGIFALFGAPMAHEDHPQRALYAALRMQEELKRYSDRIRAEGRLPIQVRVGVNTGEVVVRTIKTGEGHTEYTPIGHSTSLAARMQALAPIGSIAATEETRRLCEGYFIFKSLGPTKVKGVSEPVNVYEVMGLGPLRTRLQRSAGRGFTKFVGRQREMEALKHAAELARQGHGQIVAAMAEAGVGKSRLLFEFKATSQSGWMVLETFSVSHGKASAYLPVVELLRSYFEMAPEDDERKRREKVTGKVLALDRSLEDILPTIFALLAISESRGLGEPSVSLDLQTLRRRTCEALKRLLVRESLNQPLMLIFEDLHWIDEESQELLNLLADTISTARILMLVNYRPEYRHEWSNKTCYAQLRLDPLGRQNSEEMLAAILGNEGAELDSLKRAIIERTEGNPFFIEEIIQSLFEQSVLTRDGTAVKLAKPLSEAKLPATVQAMLAARIDRLRPDEKELLQTLAVIGKEFPLRLVKQVVAKPDDELQRMLSDLQLSEFVYEQPAFPDPEYVFKHALTQEVAYNSVLQERRKLLHGRIGAALEDLCAGRPDDHVVDLAHHFSRSGNQIKAAQYLFLAAAQSRERSSFTEAVELARRGIAALNNVADSPDRTRSEAQLQLMLAQSLGPLSSPAASEVGQAYQRAAELSKRAGDDETRFGALSGLRLHCQMRFEIQRAREITDQLMEIAQRLADPVMLAGTHALLAWSRLWSGELEAARKHGEQCAAYRGPEEQFGLNVHRLANGFPALSCALWLLGFPDQAVRVGDDLVARALSIRNPIGSIAGLTQGWDLNRFLRDIARGSKLAEAAIAIGSEYGIRPLWFAAISCRGWILAHQGRGEEGIEEIRRGILGREQLGVGKRPSQMAMLVEAYLAMKQARPGLESADEALERVGPTGEVFYEAELHRLKGELLLIADQSDAARAAQSFRTAIEIARKQHAKSWELRATTSLARLLAKQGRRDEARAMLAEIYGWFTEGFDTADLKDAKSLLDELSA